MHDLERRYTPRETFEFRAASKRGTVGTLTGYAAKYDTLSRNLGGFVETIRQGAFDKSLADGVDVLVRYNHGDEGLLGRTSSGTARVSSDSVGLLYEVDLPDTSVGRDVATLAERGDVYQSSFAFYTVEDSWGQTDQGFPLRSLIGAQLVDVAPVNSPAYLDTSVGLRSFASAHGLDFATVQAAAAGGRLRSIATLIDPDPVDPDTQTCPVCAATSVDDNGGRCACAPGCDCVCEVCTCTPGTLESPDPMSEDMPRSAPKDAETPQVANHGLVIVRSRLHALRQRRDI